MKKVLLLASAFSFLLSLRSSAQITKGTVLLGGGISGGHSKSETNSEKTTSSSFSIYPVVGVAAKENTVVGVRLSYSHGESEQPNGTFTNVQDQNSFGGGLFYRRYMGLGKKFYLFGEAAAYYVHGRTKNEIKGYDSKATQTGDNVGVNFYPGVAFAISRKIHLEVGLNNLVDFSYGSSKTESRNAGVTNSSKSSGFSFTTNVSTAAPLTVGFRFVLGK